MHMDEKLRNCSTICSKQLLILLIFLHKFLHNRFFNEDDCGKQQRSTMAGSVVGAMCARVFVCFGMQLAPLVKLCVMK